MNRSLSMPVIALLTIMLSNVALAEDWPTFRGKDRTAVSSEAGLLDSWGADGPKLLFTAKGAGSGYASPVVADDRIYTLGDAPSTAADGDEYLTCFDARTGQLVWMQKTGPAWTEGAPSWKGARGTPTVSGDMLYVITPFGKIVAAKTADGQVVWQRDLKVDFAGKKGDGWGYSESPLVDDDKLICTPGGSTSTVVALNKQTGELIWTCARPDDLGAGHSSAVVSNVGGRKVVVQNTAAGPLGVDAETGQLLWDYDRKKVTAFIPSPIISGNLVLSVAGYGGGGALLEQIAGSDSAITIKEIYAPESQLSNKHGGVLLLDGLIYGSSEDSPRLYCADLKTGEFKWRENGSGSGSVSLIAADGKLYARFANGVMALAKADESGYQEISSFKTPGSGDGNKPSWAHPVIANGKLLLREGDAILCYEISKSASVL